MSSSRVFGVLSLAVTDTSAKVAASVANTLAADAVTTENQEAAQPTLRLAAQLQSQINSVNAQISSLDGQIQQAVGNPGAETALLSERADASQQLAALTSQRTTVEEQSAQAQQAAVVDSAQPPSQTDPSRLPLDVLIGLLAGLIAGIGLAALLEALRPTAVGSAAIGRTLAAPVLGVLNPTTLSDGAQMAAVAARVRQEAARHRLANALLWTPSEGVSLAGLAERLQDELPASGPGSRGATIRVLSPAESLSSKSGLVVVVTDAISLSKLAKTDALCTARGWPLLGAVVYQRRVRWPAPRARGTRRESGRGSQAAAA